MQSYNQKIRHFPEIELVPTILKPFSFCPLIQTFCASPNGVHMRELTVVNGVHMTELTVVNGVHITL